MTAFLKPGDKIVLVMDSSGTTPREAERNMTAMKAWFESHGIDVQVNISSPHAQGLSVPVVIRDEQ